MPLLQFLAYYQAIEFYFPVYAKAEAQHRIRQVLKDPTIRSDRDTDIGRILASVDIGSGYGDERSQLRATIHECVSADTLRDYLSSDEKAKEFFSSKTKGLTDHKIPIANETADLRPDVADRIYDLRCKIVHTKSNSGGRNVELLLPFSKEAELLHFDISLIEFLAQHVLIAASTPM